MPFFKHTLSFKKNLKRPKVCVSFPTLEIDYLRQDGIFARAKVDFAASALFLSCFFLRIFFSWIFSFSTVVLQNLQSKLRVATATFWRTFHHDGKICPGW
jgi:hypothetical protein